MATYYVSTTGSDTNTGGAADPFLTVNKAVTVAGTGATVNVAAGTYVETATVEVKSVMTIVGATGTASDVVLRPAPRDRSWRLTPTGSSSTTSP